MNRILYLLSRMAIATIFLSHGTYSLDTAYLQKIKTEEQNAYAEINEGKVKEGLRHLVQLFREAPLDDAQCIEPLLGPYQLFCCTMNKYDMITKIFYPDSSKEKELLLEPSTYITDRLLITGALIQPGLMDINRLGQLYNNIPKLIESNEKIPNLMGILFGILIFPDGQKVIDKSPDLYRAFSVSYIKEMKDIRIQQLFVEIIVLSQLEMIMQGIREKKLKSWDDFKEKIRQLSVVKRTSLIDNMNRWGIQREEILSLSPGLNSISVGLPTLDLKDMNRETFKLWSDMLKNTTNSQVRYILLSFLRLGFYYEDIREELRNILEDLSKEPGSISTMEGIYARCILTSWDIYEHRAKDLYFRSKELMQTGVLPGVFSPRSLYDERERALRSAYNYFVKLCWNEYAVELGEWVKRGQKFEYIIDMEMFKREPLYVSMKRIRDDTSWLRYNKDEEGLKNYYLEIAKYTPNVELKSEMMSLAKEPLRDIIPRATNNTPPPTILDLIKGWALDNAKKRLQVRTK